MKSSIIRYGLFAAVFQLAFYIVATTVGIAAHIDYGVDEVVGYAGIVESLSFVYFGIRYYRDKINGGNISFLNALTIGLLIVLFPALCFGLTDMLFIMFIDPHFYDKYSAYLVADLRKSVPPGQLQARLKEMQAQMQFYRKPVVNFVLMFITVAMVGIVISVLSALMLFRKSKKLITV